jgi:hypothetical protein
MNNSNKKMSENLKLKYEYSKYVVEEKKKIIHSGCVRIMNILKCCGHKK